MRDKVRRMVLLAPLILLAFLLFIALGGVIVQNLWNWLLPDLFGWSRIDFWQALGLLALCRILFGGLGLHGSPRSRVRRRIAERWETMPPEKQERLRRFGFGPSC